MAPKTNAKSPKNTKTSKSKKASVKQDTIKNQKKNDASECIRFDPLDIKHVALFWEDLYQLYLLDLSEKDAKFFKATKGLENLLKADPGLAEVLVLFKRIVPTIRLDDYEPYNLLYEALVEMAYNHDYNNLCIFVRIATTRLNEMKSLEKTKRKQSDKGLMGNALSIESTNKENREEAELLVPLFEDIIKNKQDFNTEYINTIVPRLIENRKVFLRILSEIIDYVKTNRKIKEKQKKTITKKRTEEMESIKKMLTRLEYTRINKKDSQDNNTNQSDKENKILNNLQEEILKDKRLYKRVYGQFDRRRKKTNESHWIVLPSVRLVGYKPYIESVQWKKLDPWPIVERIEECSIEKLLVKYETNPELFIKKIKELNKKIQENNAGFSCKDSE